MSKPPVEVRSATAEIRMVEADGRRFIEGYGAVFNSLSQPMETRAGKRFVERIAPGAFARALAEADVRGLFNHDPNMLLGRRSAGTLTLAEDAHGLRYRIDPPDTQAARDVMSLLARGDLSGSSFSFLTIDDDWTRAADGMEGIDLVRELRSVHLLDVGPVTFPAYVDTSAAMRSLDLFLAEPGPADVPARRPLEALIRHYDYFAHV